MGLERQRELELEEVRAREREMELARERAKQTQEKDAIKDKPVKEKKQKKVKKLEKWMVDRTEKKGKEQVRGEPGGPSVAGGDSSSKASKDGLTVDQWNDVRKELGLKP